MASVARRVRAGEAQGLSREQAIRHTSTELGIDPEKVRWCVDSLFGAPALHLPPTGNRRRGPGGPRLPYQRSRLTNVARNYN